MPTSLARIARSAHLTLAATHLLRSITHDAWSPPHAVLSQLGNIRELAFVQRCGAGRAMALSFQRLSGLHSSICWSMQMITTNSHTAPQLPPRSICLLRLSALGDITHALSVVRAMQRAWPDTTITWVVGAFEARLLEGLQGVELIRYDKRSGLAGWRQLRRQLHTRRFDALLLMQLALRANLLSTAIHAPLRIGFDHSRSREGHGLFVNRRIEPGGVHVLDVLARFTGPLGLPPQEAEWRLPVSDSDRHWARTLLPDNGPTLLISPCSSHALRDWRAERYAQVANYAAAHHGFRIVLIGGPSARERAMGDAISKHLQAPAIDLVGKDTLRQLPALLERGDALLSPDSGPVHIANAVGTRVLGLYACTDAERSGPYSDRRFTVNRYAEAAQRFRGVPVSALRWGQRIEQTGVMDLIEVDAVCACLDRLISAQALPESR